VLRRSVRKRRYRPEEVSPAFACACRSLRNHVAATAGRVALAFRRISPPWRVQKGRTSDANL